MRQWSSDKGGYSSGHCFHISWPAPYRTIMSASMLSQGPTSTGAITSCRCGMGLRYSHEDCQQSPFSLTHQALWLWGVQPTVRGIPGRVADFMVASGYLSQRVSSTSHCSTSHCCDTLGTWLGGALVNKMLKPQCSQVNAKDCAIDSKYKLVKLLTYINLTHLQNFISKFLYVASNH